MKKYTYLQGRKCLHCGEPIPDQKHLALKFCDYQEQGKTSKDSCKNKYWSRRKTKDLKAYRSLVRFHKSMSKRIHDLLMANGEIVTIEDLNRYGINLYCPIKTELFQDKSRKFYFIGYLIEKSADNSFKIKQYELLLG